MAVQLDLGPAVFGGDHFQLRSRLQLAQRLGRSLCGGIHDSILHDQRLFRSCYAAGEHQQTGENEGNEPFVRKRFHDFEPPRTISYIILQNYFKIKTLRGEI